MAETTMNTGKQGTGNGKPEAPPRMAFGKRETPKWLEDGCGRMNERWFVGPYGVPKENPLANGNGGPEKESGCVEQGTGEPNLQSRSGQRERRFGSGNGKRKCEGPKGGPFFMYERMMEAMG